MTPEQINDFEKLRLDFYETNKDAMEAGDEEVVVEKCREFMATWTNEQLLFSLRTMGDVLGDASFGIMADEFKKRLGA